MKSTFLNVALVSLLAVSMPLGVTSCKDYGDDIDRIDQTDNNMKSQISALETALAEAKSAAETAKAAADAASQAAKDAASKGDEALAAAQQAKADAAAALAAAQQAKQEAIEAALAAIKDLPGGVSQDVIDGLLTKISAIDNGLATLKGTVSDHGNAIEQMQIQIAALNNYKALLESLGGADGKLAQIDAAISAINEKINSLPTSAAIDEINRTLSGLSETVGKIEGNLVTFLTGRLTSVTLVPSLYLDGIETIEFLSLEYTPMKQGGATGLTPAQTSPIIVSTEENPAQYRLNPTSTGLKDIDADNIEFVALKAEARGVVESPIEYVKGSAEIAASGLEKGILTVNAKKVITGSLNLPGNDIYTVALKVPIAASHLQDPSVPEYVYSEYSRLVESVSTPRIAAAPYTCTGSAHSHYSDSTTMWNSKVSANELITVKQQYNMPVDLEPLVTGCLINVPQQITKEELAKYGMKFVFGLPTAAYTTGAANGTNQQEFIKFQDGSNSVVISKTPAGLTDNKAAIDKEPIVRVSLVDFVHNKLVDQRYIKIKWEPVTVAPVDLGEKEFTGKLGCEAIGAQVIWRDFVNDIYAKLNMSKEQFTSIYLNAGSPEITPLLAYNGRTPNVVVDGNVDADAAVIKWSLDPDEIGTIVKYNTTSTPHTYSLDESKNKYGIKLTFVPNNPDYPKVTYTLKLTIGLGEVPSINGFYGNYWQIPYTLYDVYPVQYGSAAQTTLGTKTCIFHNNLMNGFTFASYGTRGRFIVKNMSECGTWDLQFCKDNEASGYAPAFTGNEPDQATGTNIGGYNLMKGDELAAQLEWPEGHTAWCGNGAHNEAYVNLQKNDAGIGLLRAGESNESSSHLGVWATINPYNVIPVYDYNIKFVKPLNISTVAMNDHFVDGVVNGSKVDWTKSFNMRDCFGYLVAVRTPEGAGEKDRYASDLYKYYEVQAPVWETDDVRFGMKVEGNNVVVDPSATAATAMTKAQLKSLTTGGSIPSLTEEGNYLVFTSNMGSQVGGQFNIFVKVTISYGWGSDSAWVTIPVLPMQP